MKSVKTLIIICILLTGACDYPVPLSTDHTILIDKSLLGVWQTTVEEGSSKPPDFITILRFSDTEYITEFSSGDASTYLRGYLVEIGGRVVIQAEFIGDENGPLSQSVTQLFSVLSFTVENDALTFMELNSELIPKSISDSKALREAFIKEINHSFLFTNPVAYKKVRPEPGSR